MSMVRRSAVILVGGDARRANGLEKYFFVYEGKTFIERLIDTLEQVVDEIIVVAKDPDQCKRFHHLSGLRCMTDKRPGIGPIGGLHAGALAAHGDTIFVSACDMPFINRRIVRYLFDSIGESDVAIPRWNSDMIEPLHAVYRKSFLIASLEDHDSNTLRRLIYRSNPRYVSIEELRPFDPTLKTFTNINDLEELERINAGSALSYIREQPDTVLRPGG